MDHKTFIGIGAGILTAVSSIPQIVKLLRDKKANDVSPVMFFVLLAGNGAWLWYGLLLNDLPIWITNAFSVCCDLTMIFLNYRYSKSNFK